jgi:uncharacterized protein (DUF2126 family)
MSVFKSVISISSLVIVFALILSTTVRAEEQKHPNVLEVKLVERTSGWTVSATLSSPYDTPQRYADAFRVLSESGEELGVRVLLHDHAYEQPFTRSLSGVNIPEGTTAILVQGRDQTYGWGGQVVRFNLLTGMQSTLSELP